MMRNCIRAVLIVGLLAPAIYGDIQLSFPFGNNMVLQREMETPIWGTGDPGEEVTVTFNGQTRTATTDAQRKWELKLGTMAAGGPYEFRAESVNNTVIFINVMVGDVWFCSGQSNMDRDVDLHMNPNETITSLVAGMDNLHIAQGYINRGWTESTESEVLNISATGFYFLRNMVQQYPGVPFGLLEVAQGGTSVEQWMDTNTVNQIDVLEWGVPFIGDRVVGSEWPNMKDEIHYGIRGAVWYQGEANASNGYQDYYRDHLKKFITGLRAQWNQGDFPFYVVQLPLNGSAQLEGDILDEDDAWATVREAQRLALNLNNTALVPLLDLGDPTNIHPLNKWDVGLRISYVARAYEYGETNLVYSGPMYKSKTIDGNQIRLQFVNVGSGLVSETGENLDGFRVMDQSGSSAWGTATIDTNTQEVVVTAPVGMSNPVDVYYAWAKNPLYSLYNQEGLPAAPFKTNGEQVSLDRFGFREDNTYTNITVHEVPAGLGIVNPPSFRTNLLTKSDALAEAPYREFIANDAQDPEQQPLRFVKTAGADWLNVETNGMIWGTPSRSDNGLNTFSVKVFDSDDFFASANLNIAVRLQDSSTLFSADYEESQAQDGLLDNRNPVPDPYGGVDNLNAGTAIGTWSASSLLGGSVYTNASANNVLFLGADGYEVTANLVNSALISDGISINLDHLLCRTSSRVPMRSYITGLDASDNTVFKIWLSGYTADDGGNTLYLEIAGSSVLLAGGLSRSSDNDFSDDLMDHLAINLSSTGLDLSLNNTVLTNGVALPANIDRLAKIRFDGYIAWCDNLTVESEDTSGSSILSYGIWAGAYALSGMQDDDDDRDGYFNLLEYGLRGNPTNSADTGFIGLNVNSNLFTYAYASNSVDSSMHYRLLTRTNLVSGAIKTNSWDSQSFAIENEGYITVSNHFDSAEKSQLFIQLEVER